MLIMLTILQKLFKNYIQSRLVLTQSYFKSVVKQNLEFLYYIFHLA